MPGGSGISAGERDEDQCANCGAPLPAPDEHGNRTCHFCGHVHAPEPAAAATAPFGIVVESGTTTLPSSITMSSEESGSSGRGCGLAGVLVAVLVVATIAIPILFATGVAKKVFDDVGKAISSSRVDGDSAVALPGEPSGPIAFVALVSSNQSSGTVTQLAKVDGHSKTPVWSSANLSAGTNRVPLATDGTNVFTADKTRVMGLKGSDGSQLWQQSLTDEVGLPCESCFFVVGDRLVAKSKDGTVQAFDTPSGKPAWSRRLQDVTGRVLSAGSSLLVLDGTAGQYSITVLNPADGSVVTQFAPQCTGSDGFGERSMSYDATVLTAPGEASVYVGFGLLPACWQKWDLTSGAQVWNVALDDAYLDSGAYGLVDTGSLFFAGRERDVLGRIDLTTGAYTPLTPLPDVDSVPIAVHGNTLVLRGKTTRGTTRYTLWGMDLTTGAKTWELQLGEAKPADPPDAETIFVGSGDKRFTAHLDGANLRIVTFDGDTKDLSVDSLNPDTGVAGPTGTISNATNDSLPDFTVIEWRGSTLLLALGSSMLDVDTASSSISFRYP